jgi:thiamine biosynthesis lipoprotein
MGTRFTVKAVDLPSSIDAQSLQREIQDRLERVDALMSTYDPDSELSRLNRFDTMEWFEISPETATVLAEARRIAELTGGAFDVTVGPLVELWNFGPDKSPTDRVPADGEIEEVKAKTGWQGIEVRLSPPGVRKKRKELSVDLSGIAKGFAVDRVAEHLEERGIENYMVEVGGELRARGHNPQGKPWQIAVEAPTPGVRSIQRVVGLDGLGMATSGDYRNFFEEDETRYSHVIDPRSGRPIAHDLASVTVLAPSCMEADALATALLVMGPDAGYELAAREKIQALFIVRTEAAFAEKATPQFGGMGTPRGRRGLGD